MTSSTNLLRCIPQVFHGCKRGSHEQWSTHLALVQSLELEFPGARIHGCYFHFAQCLWRKVQRLGLVEEYKEDEFIRRFIQKSAAIAFVPPSFVRVSWNGLKAEMPDNSKVQNYADYFDETWINGQFRPRMWNYYAHSGPRTNNHLEGWHNRMKRIARKAHPNLYEVLELFQREQAATEVTIQQLEAGGVHKRRGGRWFNGRRKSNLFNMN